ncbi:MAG: c-type cytochrome [Chitinophagaceae bacterium]|nr:c-type cytochrome [Chitinophagaceae bacterium]
MKVFVFSIAFLSVFFSAVYVYAPHIPGVASLPDEKRTPEEELAGFKVPDGFVIELVASERDGIINPIDLTFDDAGRLWTQTASMYPLDPVADIKWNDLLELMDHPERQKDHPAFKKMLDLYEGRTKGDDKILILSDLYTPGKTAATTVWADGLTIPMSILPYKDGAYVAQGSELFFLKDSNGDGKADQRIRLFTGFGFTDTHTMAHVLLRGPGGWIHFSHGALNKGNVSSLVSDAKIKIDYSKIARFSMDGKKIELVNAGLNNIWGFQLRHNGQWYGTEANDLGYSIVPMEPGTAFPGIGNERIRSYQPVMPELHKFRVGGTGISGLAFADDISGSFPNEWKDVAFLANPITSTINAVKIIRNADGTVSATHLPDLLSSEDKYFRPVNIEFGPDGCLYIADWYDKIISHNEIPTTHPDRDKSLGRIWRIRHKSQQPFAIPDFTMLKAGELVDHLKSPSLWMKRAAWHQLTDRPAAETEAFIPAIVTLAGDPSQHELTRIHALWSLEGMGHYDAALMNKLLGAKEDDLRREAARSLASFPLTATQVAGALLPLLEDGNPMIRSEVLRTLTAIHKADNNTISMLIKASKPALPGNEMGGSYERNFERYLALKALEQYPGELYAYLQSPEAAVQPAQSLLWAVQALPPQQKEEQVAELWPKAGLSELDEPTFIWMSRMLSNQKIYDMLKPVYENSANAGKYLTLALRHQQQVQSQELSSVLSAPAQSLLKRGDTKEKQLALDAIAKLAIKVPREPITAMINNKADDKTVELALRALEADPASAKTTFMQIAQNTTLPFNLRLASLHSLAKADTVLAKQTLAKWIGGFNDGQKKELANVLSGSAPGAALLIDLYNKKRINAKAFTLSSAERVHNSVAGNATGTAILEQTKKIAEDERKAFEATLNRYMTIAAKKEGNPQRGKTLFQSCLMCHKVGDKGPGIAPALDGSAAREDKALLTAIIDPDAAVESGYMLYRVTKTDNTSLEGYLFEKNDRGTTLAFMGGSKIFVEKKAIRNEGFLTGRSFMPKGLISGYTDVQVADLLAYIRTLK